MYDKYRPTYSLSSSEEPEQCSCIDVMQLAGRLVPSCTSSTDLCHKKVVGRLNNPGTQSTNTNVSVSRHAGYTWVFNARGEISRAMNGRSVQTAFICVQHRFWHWCGDYCEGMALRDIQRQGPPWFPLYGVTDEAQNKRRQIPSKGDNQERYLEEATVAMM